MCVHPSSWKSNGCRIYMLRLGIPVGFDPLAVVACYHRTRVMQVYGCICVTERRVIFVFPIPVSYFLFPSFLDS
jgi:hypothetical protein